MECRHCQHMQAIAYHITRLCKPINHSSDFILRTRLQRELKILEIFVCICQRIFYPGLYYFASASIFVASISSRLSNMLSNERRNVSVYFINTTVNRLSRPGMAYKSQLRVIPKTKHTSTKTKQQIEHKAIIALRMR